MTEEIDLDAIRKAHENTVLAREQLHRAVVIARESGRTWSEIGLILRCSKQAARERFDPGTRTPNREIPECR